MMPRLLYYFTNVPVIPPSSFFRDLNSLLISLIWGKGQRRVALSALQLPRDAGGMGAPSFEAYFLLAQLQWLSRWTAHRDLGETDTQAGQVPVPELARILLPRTKPNPAHPLLVQVTRSCILRIHRLSKGTPMYSPLLPLVGLAKGTTPRESYESGLSAHSPKLKLYSLMVSWRRSRAWPKRVGSPQGNSCCTDSW